jgi:alpha-glucoside transport system permease protein
MKEFARQILAVLLTVTVAVGVSGALWVLANLLVNRMRDSSVHATYVSRALTGFVVASVLSGNRLTQYATAAAGASFVRSLVQWIWLPLIVAVAVGAFTFVAERLKRRERRIIAEVLLIGTVGGVLGALLVDTARPNIVAGEVALIATLSTLLFGTVGAIAHRGVRTLAVLRMALLGAVAGLVLGAWGVGDLGASSARSSIVLGAIIGCLVGTRWALVPAVSREHRVAREHRARTAVFLAPALGFIAIALVIPSLRTIYLSLLDRKGSTFVGIDNYASIFRDPKAWDMSRFGSLWTSRLTVAAGVCFLVFVLLAVRSRRRSGHFVEYGSASAPLLVLAVMFAGFAVFSTLRGTLVNNLWWVFVVTALSTGLGLLIAVLADGVRFERTAKAIIFMPLAVSMVGASVIFRLVYISRDASKPQSGTLNALWVGLGSLSTGDGFARLVVGVLVLVPTALALLAVTRSLVRRQWTKIALPAAVAGGGIWFSLRYWQLIGTGLGGQRVGKSGEIIADPINFLQEPPFNNFWLMLVLVWIQTGFAMVIFSAAIRAVPRELTEAAAIDGADTQQIFWRVTMPQIGPTIGVVATTIMVLVMKVFDIVKVMTNGNFGTEVLSNNMYREAFYNLDIGLGAALAVLIFVSVLPIMYINIRRMNRTT